ncbi:MAG: peptide-methionine (S)-S-oxide reductase MsrA [Burkholderiales bacterium]|jgi:peptide-methionine (S)-S-oxide reductase|nr:peptide-methionine (S)-S-oxide reductase MsrA [Burkholderiales bacterium]
MKRSLGVILGLLALTLFRGAAAETPATAIFAGGCFWCVEADFEKLPGVVRAESGYIGGKVQNPTYEEVSAGRTGHAEAVRVWYDPQKVTYEQLLEYFWRHVDPTVKDRQFCDVGSQYRTAVFYETDSQRASVEASKAALEQSGRFPRIYTEIAPAGTFYLAEEYHQDYYKKNPIRYRYYRSGCGRDARIAEVWGTKP